MYMYMSEYVLPEVNLLQKNLKNNTSDGCEYRPIEDNKIKTVCYYTFCRCGPKFFGLLGSLEGCGLEGDSITLLGLILILQSNLPL